MIASFDLKKIEEISNKYLNKDLFEYHNHKSVCYYESEESGEGYVCFECDNPCLEVRVKRGMMNSILKEKDVPEIVFFEFCDERPCFHILEMKKTLNSKVYKKVKTQLEQGYFIGLTLKGILDLPHFTTIAHVVFLNDRMTKPTGVGLATPGDNRKNKDQTTINNSENMQNKSEFSQEIYEKKEISFMNGMSAHINLVKGEPIVKGIKEPKKIYSARIETKNVYQDLKERRVVL
ncbi:hypothetical protein CCP2SC5_870005 [Azospirillaceae bacterium]